MSNLNTALHAPAPTILAQAHALSCDTRQTGLNNNMLVIGPSGAGKTRNVLKPNLLQMNASYIVLDTKGTLCREVGPVLATHGYRVQRLNFADLDDTATMPKDVEQCGYNPLNHIRRTKDGKEKACRAEEGRRHRRLLRLSRSDHDGRDPARHHLSRRPEGSP